MPNFQIQTTTFDAPLDARDNNAIALKSVPRNYSVTWLSGADVAAETVKFIESEQHPIALLDSAVDDLYFASGNPFPKIPTLRVRATEDYKQIYSAIDLAEFMEREKVTKASMLFVIGGGIVQDVGAFGAAMYKRGIPWTYVPTTLLAQGDSCIGGKTGLNHKSTKNLVALFSAPRHILIHTGFLKTLSPQDMMSGFGEIFRLHVTGGSAFLDAYERNFQAYKDCDASAVDRLVSGALSVKRAVVELDEFELDLRRSLNYGHSMAHAIEPLVDYRIPHGMAVTLGIMIENEISMRRGMLSKPERDRLIAAGRQIVTPEAKDILAKLDFTNLVETLRRDKKTLNSTLKLVVIKTIGRMVFVDLELEAATVDLVRGCIQDVSERL